MRPAMNTHYFQLPIHPTRINNRGPPQLPPGFVPPAQDFSNFIPPSILIGPGHAGIPLPLPPPLSQPSKTIPLHLIPTKTQVNIAESEVSFLLGLVKPKKTEDWLSHTRKQVSESSATEIINNTNSDTTLSNSVTVIASSTSSFSESTETSKATPTLSSVSLNFSESSVSFDQTQTLDAINRTENVALDSSFNELLVSSVIVINQSSNSVPNGPITDWVPFFVQPTHMTTTTWLGEPPPIITKPEEPQVFDITVKHKLGAQESKSLSISTTETTATINSTNLSEHSMITKTSSTIKPTSTSKLFSPSRIAEPDIVYGRPVGNVPHSLRPSFATNTSNTYKHKPTKPPNSTTTSTGKSSTSFGRPIVIPVDMDEVKPQIAGITPAVITEAGQGSVFIDGKPKHFKIRPSVNQGPTLQVGSGVTVNIDGGDPNAPGRKPGILPKQPSSSSSSARPAVVRRPPFRPRPNTPLVRIDTCIVGDDSTCGVTLNEKCKTELGISSCQCKPGYGRNTPRGMCSPISSVGISMKIDRMAENRITFNKKYLDSDSEEYQYLEYETLQALNSLFSLSRFSKLFMGAKVNKFYSMAGKTVVNATIELEMNNATRSNTMRKIIQQELTRVIATHNNNIGESKLFVEGSLNAIPRVEDINECANAELHDCPKTADCINEFGAFKCVCKHGFEDKYPKDALKAGRFCASCPPQYCSNRGECLIINGERECKCKGNFIGSKCDIDGEVLGVALGGSVAALIIIMITFICLQRWKKEQQKMEAMSSGSGQTFSYVNKQAVSNGAYRYTMDDRIRWTQMSDAITTNPTYNYYVNAEQLMTATSQHVYATPSRVHTPDALLSEESCPTDSRHCPRYSRSKSRSSGVMPYQSMGYGPGSVYNETEFSTRETLYTPSHMIVNPRSKCVVYN
ncbi:hypothetical protein B4U80_10765 [Leptotrombidium deliense]|uniref:Uncharacterized protein n=1 Tax=Leptotrombidium deliense TaxID=299467 RepID=A0A443SPH4_9ACAR|nr:hypothetical protein B4U80_10765 [Leptotrombidium deliense]